MNKTFGPKFKKILIMDVAAALLFVVHLIFFKIIASQGLYLQGHANELLPDYFGTIFKWVILESLGIVRLMYSTHMYRNNGKLKSSDAEVYLLIAVLNIIVIVLALSKAPKLFAFLNIAISHVALFKTIMVVVTYIVPLVILLAVVVLVIMWFATDRIKSTE